MRLLNKITSVLIALFATFALTCAQAQQIGLPGIGGGGGGTTYTAAANGGLTLAGTAFSLGDGVRLSYTSPGVLSLSYSPGANTFTPSLLIINANVASAGNQQPSCALLSGQGWKTTATAASQKVDWQICNEPIQGTTSPTGTLNLLAQVNGGGYTSLLSLLNGGSANADELFLNFNGTNQAPAIAIGSSNTGFYANQSGQLTFTANNGNYVTLGNGGGVILAANVSFTWTNQVATGAAGSTGTADTWITRGGAATIKLGQADAASPIAQTFVVQNVVVGTSNTAGANWTLAGSLSTGSGVSGDIIFQTGGTGAISTAQNAETAALTIKGATGFIQINRTPATDTLSSGDVLLCWNATSKNIELANAGMCS